MYCKTSINCFFMKTSRSSMCRSLQKFLNVPFLGVQTSSPVTICSRNAVSKHYLNCQRLQGGITSFNCVCQSRLVQTSALGFPGYNNSNEQNLVNNSSSSIEKPVSHEDVTSRLRKCSSLQEQMEELCRILCLAPEDLKRREQLCHYVKEMLSPFFKDCRVQMYGSSNNGFGFKGCDIDMSFSIIGDNRKLVLSYSDDPDIPFVCDVLDGKVSLDYIAELPQKEQLMFIHSVFLEYYKETSEPIMFCNGYVPIVRFHHDKYGLQCDLSFSNSFAFRNTKLLKLCGLLDQRVTPLMVTIRYWAKHVGLLEGGNSFNKYTMSLLVLYFLQTRKPPVLPSVEYLLSLSEYLSNDDMDDNSCLQDIKKIPPSKNRQTTAELLKEFFFYYAYFDYDLVMCPLTAASVPRAEVHKQIRKFRMNSICIQDPIKLVHNVATLVHFNMCKKMFKELLMAVKLFQEDKVFSPSSSNWGILSLFEKPENFSPTLSDGDSLLSFQIHSVPASPEDVESEANICMDEHRKGAWFQKVSRLVLNILEHALLFDCKVEENFERQSDSRVPFYQRQMPKNENQTGFASEQHVIESSGSVGTSSNHMKDLPYKEPAFMIKCIASQNTWSGREDLKTKVCLSNPFCDPLEIEHLISVELSSQRKKDKKDFSFICECYELNYGKHASLLVKFKPSQHTDFNLIVGLFLKDYVPRIVNKILKGTNTELSRLQNALSSV